MTQSRWFSLLPLSTALLIPACMDAAEDDVGPADDGTAVHMMPMHDPDAKVADAAPAGAHLTFFGGPTLTHVSVHPVYWNANVQFQTNLNAFYKAVTNSTLYDMLKQYSSIGRGSGVNGVVDNRTTTSVSDAAIHTELNRLFTAGSLPLPTTSNYYPVHFPAGVTITGRSHFPQVLRHRSPLQVVQQDGRVLPLQVVQPRLKVPMVLHCNLVPRVHDLPRLRCRSLSFPVRSWLAVRPRPNRTTTGVDPKPWERSTS